MWRCGSGQLPDKSGDVPDFSVGRWPVVILAAPSVYALSGRPIGCQVRPSAAPRFPRAPAWRGVHCQARRGLARRGAHWPDIHILSQAPWGKPTNLTEPIPLPRQTCSSASPPSGAHQNRGWGTPQRSSCPQGNHHEAMEECGQSGQAKGGGSCGRGDDRQRRRRGRSNGRNSCAGGRTWTYALVRTPPDG